MIQDSCQTDTRCVRTCTNVCDARRYDIPHGKPGWLHCVHSQQFGQKVVGWFCLVLLKHALRSRSLALQDLLVCEIAHEAHSIIRVERKKPCQERMPFVVDAHFGEILKVVVKGSKHATIVGASVEETESLAKLEVGVLAWSRLQA